MLVVRTSFDAMKADTTLQPTGVQSFEDQNGKRHTFELAHYEYLGDTHIRFVIDSADSMANLTAEEFKKLKITPEDAVEQAIANIHEVYGKPRLYELDTGAYQLQGEAPDYTSSFFVDMTMWQKIQDLLKKPLVIAVPSREVLLFAQSNNEKGVGFLRDNVEGWFAESGRQGVSKTLYIFENGSMKLFEGTPKK